MPTIRPMEPLSRLAEYVPPVRKVLPLPSLALATVVSKDGQSVYASSDTLFRGAVFGRDSLEVAEDLMRQKPQLVENILLTLGSLQGCSNNDLNEEERGKIVHEYRATEVDGKPIEGTPLEIYHELSKKWGGNDTEMAYYGSVDATPHFLRTLGTYCLYNGTGILDRRITKRNGQEETMRQVADAAVGWVVGQLAASQSGLIEFKKRNPHGLSNQVWKDSKEFYVHENGEVANHKRPIASIEVQALGYDALLAAARLFPDKASDYLARAELLRDTAIETFWQPERQYFALGCDYLPTGQKRIIGTTTANPAALLDSEFFDQLAPVDRQRYITGIVRKIMGPDFLTNAGIRSRSLAEASLVPFWDYHGSYVSWPKETYDIAKGMRRHGFPALGRQLENRLLNIVLKTREYPEFVYVDGKGRVLAGAPSPHTHGELVLVEGPNTPERTQAWTVSALFAIVSGRGQRKFRAGTEAPPEPWQEYLEAEVMGQIPHFDFYLNPFRLWLEYPTYKYRLAHQ